MLMHLRFQVVPCSQHYERIFQKRIQKLCFFFVSKLTKSDQRNKKSVKKFNQLDTKKYRFFDTKICTLFVQLKGIPYFLPTDLGIILLLLYLILNLSNIDVQNGLNPLSNSFFDNVKKAGFVTLVLASKVVMK